MEEVIRKRLESMWKRNALPMTIDKQKAYMEEAKTKAGQKLLKLAIDLKQVDCDFKTVERGEFKGFQCSIISVPQTFELEPIEGGNEIEIIVYNADEELSRAELLAMNYDVMKYDKEMLAYGYRADYYKIVPVGDLEEELLNYIAKLKAHIKHKVNVYEKGSLSLDILEEYFEDEIQEKNKEKEDNKELK